MSGLGSPAPGSTLEYCLDMLEQLADLLQLPDGDTLLAERVKVLVDRQRRAEAEGRRRLDA